jgi:benzil reductase ((S)-benzoin forming)
MPKKLAIITGTSSGIGKALAERLLADGWVVAGIARRSVEHADANYRHICFDLGDIPALSKELEPKLTELLMSRAWSKVALINNAAVTGQTRNMSQLRAQALSNSLAINTVAPVALMGLITRVCPPETPVRIVNISTGLASRPLPGCTDYCVSKAALLMAGKVLGTELDSGNRSNIAILSYAPGTVETAMQEKLRSRSTDNFPATQMFKQFHDEGMLVAPENVLQPIVSFMDDANPEVYGEMSYAIGQSDKSH